MTIEEQDLIAKFLGYIYKEENVDYEEYSDYLDYSSYHKRTVYCKSPIILDKYDVGGEYEQIYLAEVPNPDYGKKYEGQRWRDDLKNLSFENLYQCVTNKDLEEYKKDYNRLFSLLDIIEALPDIKTTLTKYDNNYRFTISNSAVDISRGININRTEAIYKAIIDFIFDYFE